MVEGGPFCRCLLQLSPSLLGDLQLPNNVPKLGRAGTATHDQPEVGLDVDRNGALLQRAFTAHELDPFDFDPAQIRRGLSSVSPTRMPSVDAAAAKRCLPRTPRGTRREPDHAGRSDDPLASACRAPASL